MSNQVLKAHLRKRLLSFLLYMFSIILSIMLSSIIAHLHSENVKSYFIFG